MTDIRETLRVAYSMPSAICMSIVRKLTTMLT